MRKLFRLILAPLTWFLQACSPLGKPVDIEISDNFYYDKARTDIIYSSMGNWFELGKTPLNADAESFEVLNSQIGKDRNHAYYKWHSIPSSKIDLKSFDASYADWMYHIGLDKDHVYSLGDDVIDGEWQLVMNVIEGADPNSFRQLDIYWSKDNSNHFYDHKMIPVAYESFEVINDTFAKDKDSVYLYYQGRFETIDAGTEQFEKMDRYYARDSEAIYYFLSYVKGEQVEQLKKIPFKSYKSVEIRKEDYLLVDEQVFYRGILVEGANRAKLEVIHQDMAKDDQYVYYRDDIIQGADPETFDWDDEKFVYRDKNRTYNNEELTKRTSGEKLIMEEEKTSSEP